MQGRKTIKILATVTILVIICVVITYVKSDTKEVLATTKEFNSENLQDNEHMHVELDSSGDKVPVPNGYVGSKATGENEIDTGYVIYEGEEEVNDSNIEEAQKTRNQYVWIPVPNVRTMYGTDENGKNWGKLYNFTTNTGTNIDPITGTMPLNWSENNGVMKVVNKASDRVPDVVTIYGSTPYDMDSKIKNIESGTKTTHDFLIKLEEEFNDMIKSVKEYGGFYIGRYETGNLKQEIVVVKKLNEDIVNETWYNMYQKCKRLKDNNKNIETGMMWANQYDRILMWLIETGDKSIEEICKDSTSWGNYSNSTFQYTNSNENIITKNKNSNIKIPTGSSDYTKANTIYDLAGNVIERMIITSNGRKHRGGAYNITGNGYPVTSYTTDNPNLLDVRTGCRAMLYIK